MLTVLIADDEINICHLIKNEIEWDSLDLQLMEISTNSIEVLEMTKKLKPDIVITDIQMPCLSGLSLIKETRAEGLRTNFIIISGFSYFEYAKEAISLGVDSFLLKPINHKELNDALSKIINNKKYEIQNKQRDSNNTAKIRKSFLLNPPFSYANLHDTVLVNKEYLFAFSEGFFILGGIAIDSIDASAGNQLNMDMLIKAAERNCSHLCVDYEICEQKKNRILFLMNYKADNLDALNRSFQYLLNEVCNTNLGFSNIKYTLALSAAFSDLTYLSKAFSQVSLSLSGRIITGFNRIEKYSPKKEDISFLTKLKIAEFEKDFIYYMEIKDYSSLVANFDCAIKVAPKLLLSLPYEFYYYLGHLVSAILSYLKISFDQNTFFETLDDLEDISLYTDFLHNYIKEILDGYTDINLSDNRKAVSLVKEYVNTHSSEHITLDTVADNVYLAPAYISTLFKQETGINFIDYVTSIRINNAKDLLKNTQQTIKEIALHIGYHDEKYFSKMFKKIVGIKPSEYRKVHNNF